jgi:hypothetical protein
MCVQLCMRTAVLLLLQLYVPCTLGLYVQSYAACTGAMPCMRSHACMHRMHRAPPPPPPPPPPRIAARARSRRRRRESQRALAARPPAPRAAAAAGAMHPRRRPSRRAARLDVRCVQSHPAVGVCVPTGITKYNPCGPAAWHGGMVAWHTPRLS